MSSPEIPEQSEPQQPAVVEAQTMPPSQIPHVAQGGGNGLLGPLMQLMQSIAQPLQTAFKLRTHTKLAKNRVNELRNRVARLEAEIESASRNNDTGKKFDRYR